MNSTNRQPRGGASQPAPQSTASAPASARTAPEAQVDGGRNEAELGPQDAPPTNRASLNCKYIEKTSKTEQNTVPCFQSLRWGVDSLYLSYPGELHPDVLDRLKSLKAIAQSADVGMTAQAQYEIDGHLFEVKDKGARLFPYVLEDGAFRIQLSKPSKKLPMAYVKIASGYLAQVGPVAAEKALHALLEQLGELRDAANVSRIDLFVDFVSSENMEWNRHAWVTRAALVNTFAVNSTFSGWSIGQGGV